jgi:hypothetical protein
MCEAILPYLGPFFTLLIGAAAWYLAHRQQRTNELRLKHELFERRYKVYDSLMAFLGRTLQEGKPSTESSFTFLRETNQAQFLFGPEIPDYLESVYKKGNALRSSERQLNSERQGDDEERSRMIKENTDLIKWFNDQPNMAGERFGKYLNLTRLK